MSSKWPYVAGIFDGEGCVCLHERKPDGQSAFFLQVLIYNTSMNLMKWLVGNFGGKFYTRTQTNWSQKIQYVWHPSGKKNRESFLLGVLPYLVIKRKQAEIALEFCRLGYGEQEKRRELVQRCCLLNQREESVETNTPNVITSQQVMTKIEPELIGDDESAPDVNQGLDIDHCPRCKEYLHDEMGHMCPSNLA
jgi:hypothetical protein